MFSGSQQRNLPAGQATWARVGAGTGNVTNSTSIIIIVPPGVADGDLMFLYAAGFCASGAGCISCGGFTTAVQGTGGMSASHPFWAATRVASSEPSSYTVTFTAAAWAAASLLVLRSSTGISMVANTGVYNTASSYVTVLPNAPLTIATPLDATVYAYGGQDSVLSGANSVYLGFTGLSDLVGSGNFAGSCAAIGWGVNTAAPAAPAVVTGGGFADPVDVAIDVVPN